MPSSAPLRRSAAAFDWIPWYTSTLSSFSDLEEGFRAVDFLKTFPTYLQRYESHLLSIRSFSQRDQLMRDLFGIRMSYAVGQALKVERIDEWAANWSPADAQSLCSLICGYRLLDVMALVHGLEEKAPVVQRTMLQSGEQAFDGMECLHDWPGLLLKFRKSFRRSENTLGRDSPSEQPDSAVRLMRLLAQNVAKSSVNAIECNLIVAAMHLAYLTTTKHRESVVPDLPDSQDALASALSGEGPRLRDVGLFSQDDAKRMAELVQFVKDMRKGSGAASLVGLRSPLQLGLLISPILWMNTSTIVKYSYNRLLVLTAAHRLGNAKSDLLRRVECIIWEALMSLVDGTKQPQEMLAWVIDTLPWNRIEQAALDESESGWFKLDRPFALSEVAHKHGMRGPTSNSRVLENVKTVGATEPSSSPQSLAPSNRPPSPSQPNQPQSLQEHSDFSSNGPDHQEVQSAGAGMLNLDGIDDEDIQQGVAEEAPPSPFSNMDTSDESEHESTDDRFGINSTFYAKSKAVPMIRRPYSPDDASKSLEDGSETSDNESALGAGFVASARPKPPPLPPRSRSTRRLNQQQKKQQRPAPMHSPARKKRSRKPATSNPYISDSDGGEDSAMDGGRPFWGKSAEEAIDVDLYTSLWEPSSSSHYVAPLEDVPILMKEAPPPIKSTKSFTAYDAEGNARVFSPSFHHEDYHQRFEGFFKRIKETYLDGRPPHIADPKKSILAILSNEEYMAMPPAQLKAIMLHRIVLVRGCPVPLHNFDEDGLQTLASMHLPVSLQDFSAGPQGDLKSFPENVIGTVGDLLESAQTGEKILNGLEFPMVDAPVEHTPYTSDLAAWRATSGAHRFPRMSEYPKSDMRWGLGATANAFTFMHIDSDGYNTFLKVICGEKLWGIYCEGNKYPLSSIDAFTNPDFGLDEVPPQSDYGIEAVVIKRGDLLLMKAGTPHFALSLEPCILHGGHYYMMDLMQETVQSLIHSFVLSNFITNVTHHPSRALLRRMLIFCYMALVENVIHKSDSFRPHLPNINTMDGVLNLLSLASVNFLGNVLDFRTYSAPNQGEVDEVTDEQTRLLQKYDRCHIAGDERASISYARGVAISIFGWVRQHCTITTPSGDTEPDLPSRYITGLLKSLTRYKAIAMEGNLVGAPHCSTADLEKQIENVVKCDGPIAEFWEEKSGDVDDNLLSFGPTEGYCVDWSPTAFEGYRLSEKALQQMGTTTFDANWKNGEELRLRKEAALASMGEKDAPRPLKRLKLGV